MRVFHFEISPAAAEFAEDAIDALEAGPWETWQDEGDVPADEAIPRLEVYHSRRIGWIEAQGDPRMGGTWRIVLGPNGARALIHAAEMLAHQRKAAKEDGPVALAGWRRLTRGARALVAKIESYAVSDR